MSPTAILFPLLLVYSLPLLNFARYSPVQDWWTNALTLVLVAVPLLLAGWQARRDQARFTTVPWFLPGFALWWLLLWLGSLWRYQQHSAGMLPFELFGVLLVALGACLLAAQQDRWGRERLVAWLAYAVLAGALLQALIGVAQIAGWAPLADGWLVFSGTVVMGNTGQRNQFAHVLSWGVVAVAYLWSRQRLQLGLAAVLVMFLSLLAAWSGGRLPLAYAGAMLAVGLLWHRREPQLRIGQALLWAAAAVVLFQLAGKPLAQWLFGLDIGSGLDRLGDAGFGARRRVEWAKCWEIVQAYPWLGTGYGGYGYQSVWLETFGGLTKVPESSLFTHSHNLITQLAAETGVPATLLAASVVAMALWPYLQRQHATAENAFLLLMGAITLGHSMFEYPLWYLPFLFAFFVVLALSPKAGVELALRASMRRVGAVILGMATLLYIAKGAMVFPLLVASQNPSRDIKQNQQQIEQLISLSANPFWRFESELMLSNFLMPSPSQLAIKLRHHEELVAYRPYPMLLCKLAMLRQWSGQAAGAQDSLRMLQAAYPVDAPRCAMMIASSGDTRLQPLLDKAAMGAVTQQRQGDAALVRQVTMGLPVRPPLLPHFN